MWWRQLNKLRNFCFLKALEKVILISAPNNGNLFFWYSNNLCLWYSYISLSVLTPSKMKYNKGIGCKTEGRDGLAVRVHTILSENWSSIPSAQVRQHTTTCNLSFRGSDAFFWTLQAPALMCAQTHTETPTHVIKNKSLSVGWY